MSGVLHVIDDGPGAGWPAATALAALGGGGVIIVGGSRAESRARESGLKPFARLSGPLGRPELAWRGLRRLASGTPGPGLVHAWSAASLALVSLALPRARCVATITSPPLPGAIRRSLELRAIARASRTIFSSRWVMDAWMEAGACLDRAAVHPLPLSPVVDRTADREQLRESWGVDERTAVIMPCGDEPAALASKWFCHLGGVATVAGRPVAVVFARESGQLERAVRHAERHHHRWRVIVESRPQRQLLRGCDAAVWGGASCLALTDPPAWRVPGVQLLSLSAASGLALVAEDHPAAREALLGDAGVAWFAPRRPRDLLAATLHTLDDLHAARARTGPLAAALAASRGAGAWRAAVAREHALARGGPVAALPVISAPAPSPSAPIGRS